MKTMKEAAPAELEAVRRRAIRALAVREIEEADCTYITSRLDEILHRVKTMKETRKEAA